MVERRMHTRNVASGGRYSFFVSLRPAAGGAGAFLAGRRNTMTDGLLLRSTCTRNNFRVTNLL
jgi:hypothetical protein